MGWETEYPTVATIKEANFNTLQAWDDNLPPPQTDVERTVRKRIEKRLFELAGRECREKAPGVADKWNELMGTLDKSGVKGTNRM